MPPRTKDSLDNNRAIWLVLLSVRLHTIRMRPFSRLADEQNPGAI